MSYNATTPSSPTVCIVGAGIAGLRAAEILIQRGAKVTMFEARGRIGGRCAQGDQLGSLVDLGPNWIHNMKHSPLGQIAKQSPDVDIVMHPIGDLHSIFDSKGHYMDQETAKEEYKLVWQILDEACEFSTAQCANIEPGTSMMQWFHDELDEMDLSESTRERLPLIAEMWGAFVGVEARKQSLKYMWLDVGYDESRFMANTYKNLMDIMANRALRGTQLHTNREVLNIDCQPRSKSIRRAEVHIRDHDVCSFDEVVLTTPLGWLKTHQNCFIPPLPGRLSAAIDNITYGKLEKAFLRFPRAFWDSENYFFPAETLFLRPEYAGAMNASQTYQEMVSLSCLPQPHAHPTLMFYVIGENAAFLTSSLSAFGINSPEYASIIVDFFKPYYSRLPNYSSLARDCVPEKVFMTSWQTDPFAGHGSFTNFQVGLLNAEEDLAVLRDAGGMGPERGVWFAGEHCGEVEHGGMGTLEGAYGSGEKVALRIAERWQLGN